MHTTKLLAGRSKVTHKAESVTSQNMGNLTKQDSGNFSTIQIKNSENLTFAQTFNGNYEEFTGEPCPNFEIVLVTVMTILLSKDTPKS